MRRARYLRGVLKAGADVGLAARYRGADRWAAVTRERTAQARLELSTFRLAILGNSSPC
jgi:hypothetical protein